MATDKDLPPWWERVSDPDPKVREQAHKDFQAEQDRQYESDSEASTEPGTRTEQE